MTLAGQAGLAGHLNIGNNVVAAASGITNDVPDETAVMGSPAMPLRQARRAMVIVTKLPEVLERIRRLESQVAELAADQKE